MAGQGRWLQGLRRRAGYARQEDLAKDLGVSRGAVGNWESDRGVPTMANAERLAVLLHRSRSEVLAKFGYPIGGGGVSDMFAGTEDASATPDRATASWSARDVDAIAERMVTILRPEPVDVEMDAPAVTISRGDSGTAAETAKVEIRITPEELEAMLQRAADAAVRKLMAELEEGRGG